MTEINTLSKFQYRAETKAFDYILAEEGSSNGFRKHIVSRVYALSISILSAFALTLKIIEGFYLLGKGIVDKIKKNPTTIFSSESINNFFKQFMQNIFGVAFGSVVGLISPQSGRKGFLEVMPQLEITGTSQGMERTDQAMMNEMYEMADHMHTVLERHGINYCVDGGMILGYHRHKDAGGNSGFIPWDDDLDIAVHENQKDALEAAKADLEASGQYRFRKYPVGYTLERTVDKYGAFAPALDIYLVNETHNDGLLRPSKPQGTLDRRLTFGTDLENDTEVVHFGPTKVRMLKKAPAMYYLSTVYGSDWNSVVYRVRDHVKQLNIKPTKVHLHNDDRLPAAYTGNKLTTFTPQSLG